MTPSEEIMLGLDRHRFHNPLEPKTCYFCKVETYRAQNTPVSRWSKAFKTVIRPPMAIAVPWGLVLALMLTVASSPPKAPSTTQKTTHTRVVVKFGVGCRHEMLAL
jgi:hypothetical protein